MQEVEGKKKNPRQKEGNAVFIDQNAPLGNFWELSSLCAQILLPSVLPKESWPFQEVPTAISPLWHLQPCSGTSGMLKFQGKTSPRMGPAGPQMGQSKLSTKGQKFTAPSHKFSSSRINTFKLFSPQGIKYRISSEPQ